MPRESFSYPGTHKLFDLLQDVSQCSGVSRAQAFEDFLQMTLCALSGGAMEAEYLATVQKHAHGEKGSRGCDRLAAAFGELIAQMEDTRDNLRDVLGDLFQGAITYGEAGQFLTPEPICRMMAQVLLAEAPQATERAGERRRVFDPCCGSGRLLLAVAETDRTFDFVGQDVDLRCVRMTAINLALRNLYGYVIHGDSLRCEEKRVYRSGFNGRGFVREIPIRDCEGLIAAATEAASSPQPSPEASAATKQLHLF